MPMKIRNGKHPDHPETPPGFVFIGNFNEKDFLICGWETKVKGKTAYDKDGRAVTGLFPVLVSEEERHKHNEDCAKQYDLAIAKLGAEKPVQKEKQTQQSLIIPSDSS